MIKDKKLAAINAPLYKYKLINDVISEAVFQLNTLRKEEGNEILDSETFNRIWKTKNLLLNAIKNLEK